MISCPEDGGSKFLRNFANYEAMSIARAERDGTRA